MSKKTKKAAQTRQSTAGRPASTTRQASSVRQATAARQTAARQTAARAASKGRAHVTKAAPRVKPRTVRIVAGGLAVLSLAGFVSLLGAQAVPYTAWVVVELVLLALVAGICIFTLIRPDMTARWFFQTRR